jgi:molybdopterin molybdotransferase
MIPVEEALERCLALAAPLEAEAVRLAEASGRWMCAPALARRDQPPFPASAMDGYAVQGDPGPGDSFAVVGEAGAGHAFAGAVGAGQAVRIFTGAPVPEGATRVVIQEDVTRDGDRIVVNAGADSGLHIRPQGQDFRIGDGISPRRLRPADLAVLAAMNLAEVPCTRKPVVAIIATGDELVMPGEDPRPDQIIASNSFALKAMVEAEGGVGRLLPIARDSEAELATVLGLAEGADLIVTIGGASVGDHDLVGRVAGLEHSFWKLALAAGQALDGGQAEWGADAGAAGKPGLGDCLWASVPAADGAGDAGRPCPTPRPRQARLAVDLPANGPRAHYMRARLSAGEGMPVITPFDRQDSALLSILGQADALLIRPVSDGPRGAGSTVDYLPL